MILVTYMFCSHFVFNFLVFFSARRVALEREGAIMGLQSMDSV